MLFCVDEEPVESSCMMGAAIKGRALVNREGPKVADDCLSANKQETEAKAVNNEGIAV